MEFFCEHKLSSSKSYQLTLVTVSVRVKVLQSQHSI